MKMMDEEKMARKRAFWAMFDRDYDTYEADYCYLGLSVVVLIFGSLMLLTHWGSWGDGNEIGGICRELVLMGVNGSVFGVVWGAWGLKNAKRVWARCVGLLFSAIGAGLLFCVMGHLWIGAGVIFGVILIFGVWGFVLRCKLID